MSDGSKFDCKVCKGTGNGYKIANVDGSDIYTWCIECFGEGKLDWIENIVGKKYPFVAAGYIRGKSYE